MVSRCERLCRSVAAESVHSGLSYRRPIQSSYDKNRTGMTMIKNVHGNTLDWLGEAILTGHYPVGSSLPPEPMLCEELGVSRTVVREAIKTLAAKGLVSVRPRHGTHVRPRGDWSLLDRDVLSWLVGKGDPDRELLLEIQEVRSIIEPAAAALAARLPGRQPAGHGAAARSEIGRAHV